jgi:hypothetical protein
MFKPSTYLVVTYFLTYAPIYMTYFITDELPRWNHSLTQLMFIHNWATTGIQLMVYWVGAGSLSSSFTEAHFSPYVVN